MSNRRFLDLLDHTTSRRRFLREGGLAAVVAGVATACKRMPDRRAADTSAHDDSIPHGSLWVLSNGFQQLVH